MVGIASSLHQQLHDGAMSFSGSVEDGCLSIAVNVVGSAAVTQKETYEVILAVAADIK